MTVAVNCSIKEETTGKRASELRRVAKVMFSRWVVFCGAVVILGLVIMAIFAPLIAPYDPNAQDLKTILAQSSPDHLMGNDETGRDVLSRLIYGSRISLLVGISGAGIIGMSLGLIAGYFGGWTSNIIMRCIDALMALPPLILMLAISAVLGGGVINVLIAIGVGMMPTYCRLMCAQVISIKESDYVTAVRTLGASHLRIMLLHILPNAFPALLVLITFNLGTAIMIEASLSFLGIGILPPAISWGAMVSSGQRFILSNFLMSFAPGVAILLVVLAFNMVGDGLRDALDPRLRGVL
jgi:peptide/nickel transport system permease protein